MPAVYDSARTFNAILSIFFVVILSEGWRQIASHPDQEEVLRLDINREMQKVAPDLYGKLDLLVTETLPTFSSETILPFSVQLGTFVSLSASVIATAEIGLLARRMRD
ncbi:hypothetical protein [Aliiroseovarius lamellibrachiae]|uniref:hypothetical protein n=1 Tax=Aliiroseovarius lamellibrachiae TaxID=1924933 RepID=UPI001BDFFFBC|nr:hypothetical protein [Aliiroseovarius lamellibrachiae]